MRTLGGYALVRTLMGSLNGCLERCDDLLLLTKQDRDGCSVGMGCSSVVNSLGMGS